MLLRSRPSCALPGLLLLAAVWLLPREARADGLRLGLGAQMARYTTPTGENVDLVLSSLSARVSRGRAGLTLAAPYVGLSGGRIALSDERVAVTSGEAGFRHGLGDLSVALDYNLLQNRQAAHIYVVTLGGNLRFPTASTALQIGTGEHLLGLGLSGLYGLTRQLLLFAEVRQSWVGVLTPISTRARWGELGVVYWVTEKLGATASLVGADYGQRAGTSLELNAGLLFELFPGMMMNVGGLGGLAGAGAPRAGGSLGFGFEL
jgi:hypothetical protein